MSQIVRFPTERTVELVPNNPQQEFLFDCCQGLPPSRQKRLIMRARSQEVGFLGDQDTEILIDALGLRSA
jgi:hypothetical protein